MQLLTGIQWQFVLYKGMLILYLVPNIFLSMIMDIASTYVQYAPAGYSDSFLTNVWGREYTVELCQMQMYRSLGIYAYPIKSQPYLHQYL